MTRVLTYTGIFFVAMSTLMLEVLLTRITSVSAWYHLAFFVISLAMLGMTAGAAVVFVLPKLFPAEAIGRRLSQCVVGFAISTPVGVGLALSWPLLPVSDLMSFLSLLGSGVTLALPFTWAGAALTLALTRAGLPPATAYGIDLIGAAAGCIAIIPLLDIVDAPSAALIASTIAALAAISFTLASRTSLRVPGLVALSVAVLACVNATASPSPLRPAWVKGVRELPEWFEYLGWNTYSRVTVGKSVVQPPTFWAVGRHTPASVLAPIEQRTILIDGAAGTVMARLGDSLDSHAYLAWDITAFAHHLRPKGAAAVIGVGGGRDVLEAVRVGHSPVVGVEINDLIVKLHSRRMAEFSGISQLPGVQLVTDEARSYLARDTRRYSVITMSLIDTWASTGAGAYSLSENGLYTREAWQIFLDRLAPDGLFTVSRWYLVNSPGETARMLALALETLWAEGVREPRKHLVLLQSGKVATLLVAKSAFSAADIDRVQVEAVRMGFNMMLTPRKTPAHPLLRDLVLQPTRAAMWRFCNQQQLDITPPTDARPFFFSMLKPRTWLTSRNSVDALDLSFLGNLQATQTLVYATLVSLLLTLLTVVWPLSLRRRDMPEIQKGDLVAASSYFALIGLGFMFVEIGMLSQLNVFLGQPTLALAVLLAGLIFFTGIGSLVSGRFQLTSARWARLYPLIPVVLIVITSFALPFTMRAFQATSTATRIVISLALLAPTALGMGLGFPLGLRLVARMEAALAKPAQLPRTSDEAELGPWLWGINGAFGVCASGLALGTSMVFGVDATLYIGALCYLLLPAATTRLHRSGSQPQ